ncbi:MAG: hypothetical protein H7101_09340 [Deinococcales bacterium]|nr:hypothetical protein [Chitinophagaceae bacterium]
MINSDNYEAFFLMYVDNELSITDKEMVEAFAQQNPDLQEELVVLQQAVLLTEEDIVFTNKNLLFKHIGNEITTANYEEKFLLYIDNELPVKHKAEVETFVLQHPQLQNNFTVLQQTKLAVETIICPNKKALCKEDKNRRVVYMQWFKMVAAAVVIGIIALLYFVLPTNKVNPDKSIVTLPKNAVTPTNTITLKNVEAVAVTPQTIKQPTATLAVATNKINTNNKPAVTTKNIKSIATISNNNTATTKPNSYKQNAIENLQTPLKIIQKNDEVFVTNNSPNRTTDNIFKTNIIDEPAKLPTVTNTKINASAQQVIYKELDTNTDEKTLLVGSLEINKDKLRGFLRKASKLFGNNQKPDDDKSVVAANK